MEDKENNMRKKSNKKQRVNSSAANSTDAIRKLGEWIERDNQLCYESWRPVLDYWHSKSTLSALGYQKTATTLEDFKVNRVNTNNRQFKVVDQGLWKTIQYSFTNEENF